MDCSHNLLATIQEKTPQNTNTPHHTTELHHVTYRIQNLIESYCVLYNFQIGAYYAFIWAVAMMNDIRMWYSCLQIDEYLMQDKSCVLHYYGLWASPTEKTFISNIECSWVNEDTLVVRFDLYRMWQGYSNMGHQPWTIEWVFTHIDVIHC